MSARRYQYPQRWGKVLRGYRQLLHKRIVNRCFSSSKSHWIYWENIYQTKTHRQTSDHWKCPKPLLLWDVVLQRLKRVIGMSRGAKVGYFEKPSGRQKNIMALNWGSRSDIQPRCLGGIETVGDTLGSQAGVILISFASPRMTLQVRAAFAWAKHPSSIKV
jgi:hypothetical protein